MISFKLIILLKNKDYVEFIMKVITLNLNGIRSADRKGFFEWLSKQKADIVCVQELKAHVSDLDDELARPKNWNFFYSEADKKGYSGVGIYTRAKPDNVEYSFGSDLCDREGRFVSVKFGKLTVASVYFPSGSSGDERQKIKYLFLDDIYSWFEKLYLDSAHAIICGDFNIAHKELDLRNWKSNKKNSGFLPAERKWLSNVFSSFHLVDAFRQINKQPDEYTWWSNRGKSWENNVGWRIDYQIVTENLKDIIRAPKIYKLKRFSDHAPLSISYSRDLDSFK